MILLLITEQNTQTSKATKLVAESGWSMCH